MIGQGLSLDQAPPVHVPFRFFLTAPLIAALAGVILLFSPGEVFINAHRSLEAYAIVHLYTIGFMAMMMIGALFQMLPVIGGAPVSGAKIHAHWIYFSVMPGSILLPAGFLFRYPGLMEAAATLLIIGLGGAAFLFLVTMLQKAQRKPTMVTMSYALVSLLGGIVTAVMLVVGHVSTPFASHQDLYALHIGFMFGGWVYLLIMGVTFQVVPMFFVTPEYPVFARKYAPVILFLLLGLRLIRLSGSEDMILISKIIDSLVAIAIIYHGISTALILNKRMRKIPDLTVNYFRVGMTLFTLSGLIYIILLWFPGLEGIFINYRIAGLLFLLGGVGSVVFAMLNKIIPFLVWFHLTGAGIMAPNMKEILNAKVSLIQSIASGVMLTSLLAGASGFYPKIFVKFGGFFAIITFLSLFTNGIIALRVFKKGMKKGPGFTV